MRSSELALVLERSVVLSNRSALQVAKPELSGMTGPVPLKGRSPAESLNGERTRILKALAEAKGQAGGLEGAAARLGLKRTTLQFPMRKYNIAGQFR